METWLRPEWLQGALPVLKIAFWALTALFVLSVLRRSAGGGGKTKTRAYRIFFVVVAMLFLGILGYQATWQLAGLARPDFVQFMKRYNRRPDNPATRMVRGRILDARGVELAVNDPDLRGTRWYPGGAAFCHIIGYEDPVYGMAGVEAAEHLALSGMHVDLGSDWERLGRNMLKRDEIRGEDVVLTLISDLQKEAQRAMGDRRGAAVFINPADGAILVLYSTPGYDPNKIGPGLFGRKQPDAPLLNRALQGLYPAGSTLKLLVAAAALERGVNPVIDCPAEGYRFGTGNRPIRDHEFYDYQREKRVWPGHGRLTMREALSKSSNVYFARLGVQLGGESIHSMAVRAGLTRSWTILRGSSAVMAGSAGRFPPLSDRDVAKTAQVSIGQGDMLVTPLHLALFVSAIGRNGALWAPRLSAAEPAAPSEVMLRSETARALAGMMRQTVTHGTGRGADVPGLNVAGKTGTAQNPHGDDHGWFVGFAPANDPKIAFAIVVENAGYGSRTAVPVAAAVLKKAKDIGWFDAVPPPAGGGT